MSRIEVSWHRIDSWVVQNVPDGLSVPGGATEESIMRAEQQLGYTLPRELKASYRLHDGSNRIWICEQGYLMPLFRLQNLSRRQRSLFNEVVDSWKFMREMLHSRGSAGDEAPDLPPGPIRREWWNVKWIPITYNESGDHLCVDLTPGKGGTRGQIIDWWHEQGPIRVVAQSFGDWLEGVAAEFEAGKFHYDRRLQMVQRK